jgi:hypothetical protein
MLEPEDFRAASFNLDDAFQRITAFWPGEPLCLGGGIAEGFENFFYWMIKIAVDGEGSGSG